MKFRPNKLTAQTCEFMIRYEFKSRNSFRDLRGESRFAYECEAYLRESVKRYIKILREIRKKEKMYPSLF